MSDLDLDALEALVLELREAKETGADTMFTSEYVDALRAELTAVETVTTVDELVALPDQSVILPLSDDRYPGIVIDGCLRQDVSPHVTMLRRLDRLGFLLPARVLFRPAGAANSREEKTNG